MYQITYYINNCSHQYNFVFQSLWGAIFKARAIFEEHGIHTEVTNNTTGELLAIFDSTDTWTDSDLEVDLQALAHTALR